MRRMAANIFGYGDIVDPSSDDESWQALRNAHRIFRGLRYSHRPSAPRRTNRYTSHKYKAVTSAQSHLLIEVDIFVQYLYLKTRMCIRHITLLSLLSQIRPEQFLLTDLDKELIKSIFVNDNDLVKHFILHKFPESCEDPCGKRICNCDSFMENLAFDKICRIGQFLIDEIIKLEQYLDIRPANQTRRNQYLVVHGRRPIHRVTDSDKIDYKIIDEKISRVSGNTHRRRYCLFSDSDENSDGEVGSRRPEADRLRDFLYYRPANFRKGYNFNNHFLMYKLLVCALSKLSYLTAHSSMGCLTPVFENNSLCNGFRNLSDFNHCNNSSEYFTGLSSSERYKVLRLDPDICTCLAVSPEIVCREPSCCQTDPYFVYRCADVRSSFADNWMILEKSYRKTRYWMLPKEKDKVYARPSVRPEVRTWYKKFLLNRSQLDFSGRYHDNLEDPFVMNGAANDANDANEADGAGSDSADYDPPVQYRSPVNKLDRFHNKVFTLNSSLILLINLQTLNQLKPLRSIVRDAEEDRTIKGLDTMSRYSGKKFSKSKYGTLLPAEAEDYMVAGQFDSTSDRHTGMDSDNLNSSRPSSRMSWPSESLDSIAGGI